MNKHNIEELKQLLPDRFELGKDFGKEYRQSRGINEEIIRYEDIVVEGLRESEVA